MGEREVFGMKVLLLGSGGREHALAWKLAASPLLTKLYAAPGNPGIAQQAELVALDISNHVAVAGFCRDMKIDLVVVGPEAPLVAGIADDLRAAGIRVFGPSKAAARLEGSKASPRTCAPALIFRPPPMAASTIWRPRAPMSKRSARRSSSRPTGWPPARA